MSGVQCLATENVWFDKHRYDEAEKRFYEGANGPSTQQVRKRIVFNSKRILISLSSFDSFAFYEQPKTF